MRTLVLALILSANALISSTAAQTIRGQVIDSISGAPIDRGFVVVIDDTGRELTRVLTTIQGRFTVQVGGPGIFSLRSERIGFRVWESPRVRMEIGQTYEINPLVTALPRRLATISVEAQTECEDRKGPDTGLLWEEARKALVAASWSARQDLYVHRAHRYERSLDRGRDVVSEQITTPVLSSQLPFVSADPSTLAEQGYILPDTLRGEWEWWAPDANVFLHETFHETHCFWAVRGEDDNAGLIGLAFEPVPTRELPDVAGTLWLDEESAELRFVEFVFQNPPFNVDTRHSGGRAEFAQMPSGAWILDRWHIVIPQVRGTRRRPRITGYLEAGGDVIEAYTPAGELVYENPALVTIRGTVYDSSSSSWLSGDVISIEDSEYAVETDSSGFFEIRTLLSGKHTLVSRRMEWLGLTRGRIEHDFTPGETIFFELVIPDLRTIHTTLCRGAPPDSNRVVHGEVRSPAGSPLQGANVHAEWEPGIRRRAKTDKDGRYVLCDLPKDTQITLLVQHPRFIADNIMVRFVGRDFLVSTTVGQTSFYVPERIVRLGIETKRSEMQR